MIGYVSVFKAVKQYGLVGACFGFLQGRATTFAIAFTVCGIVLAFYGKLTADYVGLVTAIQALVVGHSLKEDYFSCKRDRDCDNKQGS